MKNQKSWKSFVAGMLTMAILFALGIPALAAAGKNITVYPGVNIYIDDQKLNPKDVNGNPVEVFVYNGTTYLPVRAVSEALGKPVQWEGSTYSVYVGKHAGDKPAVWLSDLDYFTRTGEYDSWKANTYSATDNLGNEHEHYLSCAGSSSITYKLNAQYTKLTGILYQLYQHRERRGDTELSVYGDGELLWSGKVGPGLDPVNFNINVTGILELKIQTNYKGLSDGYGVMRTAIGDVGLWT